MSRVAKLVAIGFILLLLGNATLPVVAQEVSDPPPLTTFTVDAFETDLFTGAATIAIPIHVSPGTASATPRIVLRYNSSTVDKLSPSLQAQWTGLGWTLDVGGFILRDTKSTADLYDDTFILIFGGVKHDLVLVDANANIYHTKDETFWRLQYDAGQDFWTLTTREGTRHRFGYNSDSRATSHFRSFLKAQTPLIYKYLLDEVVRPHGTAVRYAYAKQTVTIPGTATSYDRAVYPDTITYTYHNGTLVGPARTIRLLRGPRADWTDGSAEGSAAYFERERLEAIEVKVGADLVRKYVFTYDYSIDRDPNNTWMGGATGDLTLRSLRLHGSDGTSTLPPLTFSYSGAHLSSATNGIGGTANYAYEYFTAPPWGIPSLHRYYGYRVITRNVTDGRSPTVTKSFGYTGAAVSSDGTEFRGHSAVRTVDAVGHYTDTWFHQDDALKGRSYQLEARSSTGALFEKIVKAWSAISPYPGATFAALSREDLTTCDGDATCKQKARTFAHDNFGNVTQIQYLGDVAVVGDERTEIIEYAPNASAYLVSLPSYSTTRDATGTGVAQAWFYYDGATAHTSPPVVGNLTRRCEWLSGGTDPCKTIGYDAYGNVIASTDARGFTTTTTYDSTFQTFPAAVTSPPTANVPGGLVTQTTYDPRFGVVTASTDPNGQTTTHTYDVFGRLTATTNPLGETTTVSYDAFGTVGQQRVTTRQPDGSPDGLWLEAYFDGFGRSYLTQKEADAGPVIAEERTFDSRGLLERQSLPRFAGQTPVWTTFAYDPTRRLSQTTYPDGTTEQRAYDDWATVMTDRAGRMHKSLKDSYGRIVQRTEPGGAITTYTYDSMDQLTQVTDAVGNLTRTTYDTLGQKTSMTEPNMGTWTYAYDANGNLTRQTDAKGQTFTFAYDALDRELTKTYPTAAAVSFTYDTGVNGKGRRTGMTDLAGSSSYTYDALGRQVRVSRSIDGVAYATQTTYTPLGQPAAITYPDGEVLTYSHDAGGLVSSVAGYVSRMTYNAAGQVTAIDYTNGVTSARTYDPLTLRLSRLHTYTRTAPLLPLVGWSKSWQGPPQQGYATLYPGVVCVANAAGQCVGNDVKIGSGAGSPIGYMRASGGTGTVPVYPSHCYSTTTAECTGWGLSLTANGAAVGYLATTAQGAQSASTLLTESQGLLLQNWPGGNPSAYLWTSLSTIDPHTDHIYASDGSTPEGYVPTGLLLYVHEQAEPGTVPLRRFVNVGTNHHYYSTANDPPTGFMEEETLGYLHSSSASGLVPIHRHYQSTTGAYLLSTSATPPTGYQLQATLGYGHPTSQGEPSATSVNDLQDLNYTYDPVRNLTAITDQHTPGASQTFTYDALDRLTAATGPYGTESYTYSAIGNLLSKAGVSYTYGATGQTCNRLMPHAVTGTSDGKTYTYDCNGNLLSDGQRTLTWDADNKPVSITLTGLGTTTFAYAGDGARVKKVGPSRVTRYSGAFEDHVTDLAQVKHIFAGALRVATRVVSGGPNAGVYFVHGDHLGSLNVLTNSSGAEVQRLTYRPFGETHTNTGTVDFDQFRFTGQEQDPETGLYFYGARYYHPELGRFISPDPIVPRPFDPQSLNRYSYVRNNPLRYTDPTGHRSEDDDSTEADPETNGGRDNTGPASPDDEDEDKERRELEVRSPALDEAAPFGSPQNPARLSFTMGPPTSPPAGSLLDDVLDRVQGILDVVGLVPGAGEAADIASGMISVGRGVFSGDPGHFGMAALSFAAAAPGPLGWGPGLGKLGIHLHHRVPKEVLKALPEDVARHPLVRGCRGCPNRRPLPADVHQEAHRQGLNREFKEALENLGRKPDAEDTLSIRDDLEKQLGLDIYFR